jgi:aspartyl-tRNA(Asn)/glutamyl-tRNA(Gln) amidotransferase subunit A
MGRIPLYPGCRDERFPGLSSWESLEHLGPITRTVADSALVLSVIAGPDDRDRHSLPPADFNWSEAHTGAIQGLRIALSLDLGYAKVDREVRDIVEVSARVFEQELGCTVELANPGFPDPFDAFSALVFLDSDVAAMRQLAHRFGDRVSPRLHDILGRAWTPEELAAAGIQRKALYNTMWRFMRNYDLMITPTAGTAAYDANLRGPQFIDGQKAEASDVVPFTFPMNLTGQPAATVPAGWTKEGLPVGLQIVGRHLDDALVLRASAAFEAARPWKHRWPELGDGAAPP